MKPLSQKDIIDVVHTHSDADYNISGKSKCIRIKALEDALLWAKSWQDKRAIMRCPICNKWRSLFQGMKSTDVLCKDCLLSRAFGKVTGK
jgi:hypothetical protein